MADRYIADSDYGNQEKIKIDFDPTLCPTPEMAAKAFYEALKPVVEAYGQNPDSELFIADPAQSEKGGYGPNWTVSWEAGPYEWGIVASAWVVGMTWYTEPYYSFDLCFTEK